MRRIGTVLGIAGLLVTLLSAAGSSTKPRSQSKTPAKKSSTGTKPKNGAAPKIAAKPADKAKPPDRSTLGQTYSSRREELRGIWITTDSPRDWDAVMKKLKESGLNAAFVRVAQGGKAIYPSKILPQDQWSADTGEDELAKAVAAAHRHGIQFHAWKVCFPMGSARYRPPGSDAHAFFEKMAAEDRLVRNAKGTQTSWLNPSDPRNHDLEVRVAGEIVQQYAVHGYHLDYIRYPASEEGGEPGFDAHYDSVSRREFEKSLGRTVKNWPADVATGPLKMRYEDWERDNLTRLVGRIRNEVRAKRPGTVLSAAVWRKVHLYRTWIKQDWPRWCRDGLLDFVVPMCYEKDMDEFRTVLARDLSHVCGRIPFIAGIGSYRLYTPEAVVEQVNLARDIGADGFVLFSINDPTDESNSKVHYKGLVDRQLAALAAGTTKTIATPCLGGPRVEFGMSAGILPRRYDTFAAESGTMNQVIVRLPKAPGASGELRLDVSVEDLKGRRIGDVYRISLKPGGEQPIPLVTAVGAVRPVARGTIGQGSAARPFVWRGPIVESVSAGEIAELRARQSPPKPPSSGLKVGVYFNGLGSDAILDALSSKSGIGAVPVYRLEAAHLAPLDVLVLPQLYELADLTPAVNTALRAWVEGGGRLILTRDAVGHRWHPRMFPEVGVGKSLVKSRSVQVSSALRGMSKGTRFDHEYKDHTQLELKPSAKVLLTESKTGKPVAASGKVGKGTVILNGLVPGNEAEGDANSHSMRFLAALLHHRA